MMLQLISTAPRRVLFPFVWSLVYIYIKQFGDLKHFSLRIRSRCCENRFPTPNSAYNNIKIINHYSESNRMTYKKIYMIRYTQRDNIYIQ